MVPRNETGGTFTIRVPFQVALSFYNLAFLPVSQILEEFFREHLRTVNSLLIVQEADFSLRPLHLRDSPFSRSGHRCSLRLRVIGMTPRWLRVSSTCIRVASTNSLIGHEPTWLTASRKPPWFMYSWLCTRPLRFASVRRDLHRRTDEKPWLSARAFVREIRRLVFVVPVLFEESLRATDRILVGVLLRRWIFPDESPKRREEIRASVKIIHHGNV